jgi:hypothetical protein
MTTHLLAQNSTLQYLTFFSVHDNIEKTYLGVIYMPELSNHKLRFVPLDTKISTKLQAGIPASSIVMDLITQLSVHTGRNTVVYYSSFPNRSYGDASSVTEWDISGFMRVLTGLDRDLGLDLVIQTPGGDPLAAEGIVEYLQAEFKGDVRLIVPYCAYSAGTLIACGTKSVIMGNHSCLGPVDPQLGIGACLNIIKDYDEARQDIIENPTSLEYWKIRLANYAPNLYRLCKDAVNLGDHLLNNWLHKYMFAGEEGPEVDAKIERIYKQLNSNNHSHGRHFTYSYCKDLGLKVEQLEDDPEMHITVMKLHHALEEFMSEEEMAKLLLNQYGVPAAIVIRQDIEE